MFPVSSRRRLAAGALAVMALSTAIAVVAIRAADHRDSTLLSNNPAVDINDIYVFQSPTNPDNTVLVMTVFPFISAPENGTRRFERDALYQFKIDNTGDAVEDLVIQLVPVNVGRDQQLNILGPGAPPRTGGINRLMRVTRGSENGEAAVPFMEVPVSFGADIRTSEKNGITAFAGLRDDPFFFDFARFGAILAGQATSFRDPGIDAFAGFNTLAIVLEIPSRMLGTNPDIKVWGTVSRLRATATNTND